MSYMLLATYTINVALVSFQIVSFILKRMCMFQSLAYYRLFGQTVFQG